MIASAWTEADTKRALEIWAEYQKQHDVSAWKDKAAAIDPATGKVWFGESGVEIWEELKAQGIDRPLYLVRVGHSAYWRKGGRR